MKKIIFFGNGPLADYALDVLKADSDIEIIFHAHTKEDLAEACELKRKYPEAHGVLASYGVMIKSDVLDLFEPEGILNIHPSLLPAYRGASPIESAILAGDNNFSVSIMKLVKAMDAGPIYYQTTLADLPICKSEIYKALAECGAKWICSNLDRLPEPVAQDDEKATFTNKLTKDMGELTPDVDSAEKTLRKIAAYAVFPKAKYSFCGLKCIVLEAHLLREGEQAAITLPCADGKVLSIDLLQPEGRKAMDAKSFLNGYGKK